MSVRRTALDVLTRPRLREIALKVGIEFYANTSRPDMLDSISRSHSIPFKDLLGHYLRDELKLACQKLDLDDTARQKQVLIKRLVTADRQAKKPKARGKSPGRNSMPKARTIRVSRSKGTSSFLDGVNDMEEPKVISDPNTKDVQEEVTRVELVWPGKRREVDRVVLPFQCIEIVNESRATREAEKAIPMMKTFKAGEVKPQDSGWRNKLIWGDNKYVLGSLLDRFAGQVDLIYIDPPFATGQDFSVDIHVGGEDITKKPSSIEEKAYRDTWGKGLQSYLQMMLDRIQLMRQLLSPTGTLYIHTDHRVSPYLKVVCDSLFGQECFLNLITWRRQIPRGMKVYAKYMPYSADFLLMYGKAQSATWNAAKKEVLITVEAAEKKYMKDSRGFFRTSDPGTYSDESIIRLHREGRVYVTKGGELVVKDGKVSTTKGSIGIKYYREQRGQQVVEESVIDNIWDDIPGMGVVSSEYIGYPTQKPMSLLRRIVEASSNEGELVADFFCGSGTTMKTAESLGRRWIGCDLSRWAIQMTRKRLLDTESCRPFEVLNLGKYERQYWQGVTFGKGHGEQKALHEYVRFVLDLYRAELTSGLAHIHGQRSGYMIHVGAADSPVTLAEIREAVDECKKINQAKLDILGWEWEMGLHDVIEAESKRSGAKLRLLQIPRECMDQRAVDAGDVRFFELAYLEVEPERRKGSREVRIKLKNFVIPNPELIPDDVRSKISKWSDFIDYWSVDFEFNEDVFHNQWQDYRTRSKRDLGLTTDWHEYNKGGAYKVLIKVFDIFGNDTTQLLEVKV